MQATTESELKQVIDKVGKLMQLPVGTPTLATVTDETKLADQSFFKNAENGDKVLIFPDKAILFRPSANKIIEVAQVNLNEQNQMTPTGTPSGSIIPTAAQTAKLKIALYNGTTRVGITSIAERQIKTKMPNIEVVLKESADKENYEKTLIDDLSNKQGNLVKELISAIGGQETNLGQLKDLPSYKDAEIVIILGKDFIE